MDNSSDFLHISDLIARFFAGEASVQESEELSLWRSESEANERLFQQILSFDNLEKLPAENHRFRAEDSWSKLVKQLPFRKSVNKPYRLWLKYVAVLLPIGLTIFLSLLYFAPRSPESGKQINESVASAPRSSSRTILVLEDGKKITLDSSNSTSIPNVMVNNSGKTGMISYNHTSLNKEESSKTNRIIVPRGGEYNIELADGTIVYLNAETELSYPVSFSGSDRSVELKGEAYFVVTRDEHKPFIVKTRGMAIRVLGTEFNVNAYTGQEYTTTTLVKGSVEIAINGKASLTLKPDQQARMNCRTAVLECIQVNTLPYTAWKDGKFVFNHEAMKSITGRLEKWYDVEFEYQNENLKELKVFGIVSRDLNINRVLELIRATRTVDFEHDKNRIIVKPYK